MKTRRLALLLALCPLAAHAGEKPAKPKRLCGMKWHSDLGAAQEAARAIPRQRKARPILWLRMLGDLAAKT